MIREKGDIIGGKARILDKKTVRSVAPPSKDEDMLILETEGERNSTITTRACHVFERTNYVQQFNGYATKTWIKDGDIPVISILNYATSNEDLQERESLVVTFEMM
eukprot:11220831-Ditylum_brightwellii.AAC.1